MLAIGQRQRQVVRRGPFAPGRAEERDIFRRIGDVAPVDSHRDFAQHIQIVAVGDGATAACIRQGDLLVGEEQVEAGAVDLDEERQGIQVVEEALFARGKGSIRRAPPHCGPMLMRSAKARDMRTMRSSSLVGTLVR